MRESNLQTPHSSCVWASKHYKAGEIGTILIFASWLCFDQNCFGLSNSRLRQSAMRASRFSWYAICSAVASLATHVLTHTHTHTHTHTKTHTYTYTYTVEGSEDREHKVHLTCWSSWGDEVTSTRVSGGAGALDCMGRGWVGLLY